MTADARVCQSRSKSFFVKQVSGTVAGKTTQQRLVQRQELEIPTAQQAVTEVSVERGKVRLRGNKGQASYWRDYKAVQLGGETILLFKG